MSRGEVKWFSASKGYGFILSDDSKEYFVHYSNLNMEGFKVLKTSQKVTFDLVSTDRGPQAQNVSVVSE